MPKLLTRPLLLLCCSWLSAIAGQTAHAEFTPRVYQARYTSTPPQLDGDLNDVVWQNALPINEFFAYQTGGDAAASATTARLLWDDRFLYLGFEMSDRDIRPSALTSGSSGRDGQLYEGDVIEFFTRPDENSPQYFEFEWSPNGDLFDARFDTRRFGPPSTDWDTDLTAAVHVDGTWDDPSDQDQSWVVETRIPLDAFPTVAADSEWRFTVARYDYFHPDFASEQLMMSTPGDPALPNAGLTSGFHTYEMYDRLLFTVPEPSTLSSAVILCMLLGRRRIRTAELASSHG